MRDDLVLAFAFALILALFVECLKDDLAPGLARFAIWLRLDEENADVSIRERRGISPWLGLDILVTEPLTGGRKGNRLRRPSKGYHRLSRVFVPNSSSCGSALCPIFRLSIASWNSNWKKNRK